MYISLYELQVMNFIASSYYLLQAKRQRKAQRETSSSAADDDVKMDGSQSVASIHSTAGATTTDEDGKPGMRIGQRTTDEAKENEQMLIKVVQGQSVIYPSIY